MDKGSQDPIRALLDLAVMDAAWLTRNVALPLIVLLQVMTIAAAHVVPPLVHADRMILIEGQEELGLVLLVLLTLITWALVKHRDIEASGVRLTDSLVSVISDALGLLVAIVVATLIWVCISFYRISSSALVAGGISTLLSISPLIAVAPGLVRARLSRTAFAGALVAGLAGLLGFFGRSFPVRADTVFELRGALTSWSADSMACAAGLLISLGIAQWRKPHPTCG